MPLADAFVDIVGDPRRFDQAWQRIQRRVKGFSVSVPVLADVSDFFTEIESAIELAEINTVVVDVEADSSKLITQMATAGQAAEAAADVTITPKANTGPLITQMAAAGSAAGSSASSGFARTFGLGLAGVVGGTAIAAGAIAGFGLKAAADIEQIAVAFNSLTGSAEEGAKVLKDLQEFAKSTPFEFTDVSVAARRLLAMGQSAGIARSELQDVLTTIGNVASVTGGGAQALDSVTLAMGQMASSGKITLENLNQISEAMPGFSGVAAIAAATGKTTAQVMEEISAGEISATAGIDALLAGMQKFPGAAGAMEAQAKTLLGTFSSFKDTLSQSLSQAFTPVIPAIKDALTQITPVLETAMGQLAPVIGDALAGILPVLGQLVQAIVPIMMPIVQALGTALTAIGPALAPLGAALGSLLTAFAPLLTFVGELIAALAGGLTPLIANLAPVAASLVGLLTGALKPLLPLIVQIGTVLADTLSPILGVISRLFTELTPVIAKVAETFVSNLQPLFDVLPSLVLTLVEAILPLVPALLELLPPLLDIAVASAPMIVLLAELLKLVVAIAAPILKLAANLLALLAADVLAPIFQSIADALTTTVEPAKELFGWIGKLADAISSINWASVGSAIADGFGAALSAVGDFFVGIGTGIADFGSMIADGFGNALDAIGQFVSDIGTAIGNLGTLIADGVSNALASVAGFFEGIGERVVTFGSDLLSFVGTLWSNILAAVGQGILNVVTAVTGIRDRILGALSGLVQSVVGVFTRAFEGAKQAALRILDGIVGAVRGIPARVEAFAGQLFNAGKAIITAFANGLKNVAGFIGDVAGSIVGAIKGFLNKAIRKINDGLSSLDSVLPFDLPRLGLLAAGGLALGPSLVAEAGKPELAIPLDDPRAQSAIQRAIGVSGGASMVLESGAITVNVNGAMTRQQAAAVGTQLGESLFGVFNRRNIRIGVRMT